MDYLRYLTHWGHDNIVKLQKRPTNHDSIMLANWIRTIKEDDIILHMGDVCMTKTVEVAKNWLYIISRLPGKKYLFLGNHDKESGPIYKAYKEIAGFTIIEPFIQDRIAFTHEPITDKFYGFPVNEWDINIHGHIHNNPIQPPYDGYPFDGQQYINVSVEKTNYAPIQVKNILSKEW